MEIQASHATQNAIDEAAPRPHRDRGAQLAATAAGIGVLPPLFHNRIIDRLEVAGAGATARLVLRETTHQLRLRRSDAGWVLVRDEFRDKVLHG